jgi:D-alanine--poly(phosphoribitol) ligase subunit 1
VRPARLIEREKITIWISAPSVDVTRARLNSVRRFVFCGEPLLREHLDAIFAACPDTVVENFYGPTETTVTMRSLPNDVREL